ncbi:MAG TPA: hypothetical protein DIT13_09220 [Verrucomicrobiales bacterium]|nr:hypothetical protein [Verrucomicrobiales bacterium]
MMYQNDAMRLDALAARMPEPGMKSPVSSSSAWEAAFFHARERGSMKPRYPRRKNTPPAT